MSNKYAIKLYEGLGFKKVSVRKKYYENGQLMKKGNFINNLRNGPFENYDAKASLF